MKARILILTVTMAALTLMWATGCDVARPFTPLTTTPIVPAGTTEPLKTPGPTMPSTTSPVAPVPTFTPLVPTTPGAAVVPTAVPAATPVLPTAAPQPTPAAGAVSPPTAGETVYVVQMGDTLSAIAGRYGTTVAAIAQRNGLADPSRIYVGQRLIIPVGGAPQPGGTRIHIVQRGETLSYIAWKYGTTVAAIVQANNLANPSLIYAGQRLVIPVGSGQPGTGRTYVVQPGDTLSAIAARFGTTAAAIATANNITNPSLIYPGQVLIIP